MLNAKDRQEGTLEVTKPATEMKLTEETRRAVVVWCKTMNLSCYMFDDDLRNF